MFEPFWRVRRLTLDKVLSWPPFNGPAKPFPKSLNGMHNDARRPILQIVPVLAGPVFRDGVRSSDEFELSNSTIHLPGNTKIIYHVFMPLM